MGCPPDPVPSGTLTGAHWPWGPGGTRVFGSGGRILLPDTPLSPWRSPGHFEIDQKVQGLGEDPSINQSAFGKSLHAAFCALGIFLTSGYIKGPTMGPRLVVLTPGTSSPTLGGLHGQRRWPGVIRFGFASRFVWESLHKARLR